MPGEEMMGIFAEGIWEGLIVEIGLVLHDSKAKLRKWRSLLDSVLSGSIGYHYGLNYILLKFTYGVLIPKITECDFIGR